MRYSRAQQKDAMVIKAGSIGFVSKKVDEQLWHLWLCELQDWFRVKHNLHPYIVPYGDAKGSWHVPNVGKIKVVNSSRHNRLDIGIKLTMEDEKFKTYDLALESALYLMINKVQLTTPTKQ